MFVTVINIVLIISRTVCMLFLHGGGGLPADLKTHINGFLRRLHRYGYTSSVFNVELQKTADGNL